MSSYTPTWNPPRGAVRVVEAEGGGFRAECSACGKTWSPGLKTMAEEQKRWHGCPVGTVDAWPTCPVCRATGKHCKDTSAYNIPSGPFGSWHYERWCIYSAATGLDAEPSVRPS